MSKADDFAARSRASLAGAAGWLVFALVLLAVFIASGALARHALRADFESDTVRRLGPLLHGDSAWRWALDRQHDVIAGHAFGARESLFGPDGLTLESNGTAIEVGLVLHGRLDLGRYPLLQFELRSDRVADIAVIVRETLDSDLCQGSPRHAGEATHARRIDLAAIDWQCNGKPAQPPLHAAMLRLRLQWPSAARATLRDVALLPRRALEMAELQPRALPAATPRDRFDAALHDVTARRADAALPVLLLPFGTARAEQVLAARDAIRALEPAALVVIAQDWPAARERAETSRATRVAPWPRAVAWAGVTLLGLALLLLRLRPPQAPRLRAAAELAGVLGVPLAFVLGDAYGDSPDPAWIAAIGVTLAFTASLLVGDAPPQGVAGGARRKGWLVALASLGIACALALALRDPALPWQAPDASRMLRYLAWAAVQQFLICVIVAERFERLFGSARWALLAAATVFALLHTPNAMLMQFTLLGGLIWIWNWQRHRALLANIVAHAASGLLLATQLPGDWLRSAEVGARYFLF